MKQRIPVRGKPLDQRKKIPVNRVDLPTVLSMGAQIPTFDPDLKTAPRRADFGIDPISVVRIISKSHLEGKHSGVAGKSLPSNSHVIDSIPVSICVSLPHTTFSHPLSTQAFGNFNPADWIAMPSVLVLLCAVRPAFVCGVAFVTVQFALLKLRSRLIDMARAK